MKDNDWGASYWGGKLTRRTMVRLTERDHSYLEALAARFHCTISDILRLAANDYIVNHLPSPVAPDADRAPSQRPGHSIS